MDESEQLPKIQRKRNAKRLAFNFADQFLTGLVWGSGATVGVLFVLWVASTPIPS